MGGVTYRNRFLAAVGAILLAGGLVALAFPVFLNDFDTFGVQISCGTGYRSQLGQATATDYIDGCRSAVAYRRVWLLSTAGLGVVLLIPAMVAWARSPRSSPAGAQAATNPYAEMHDAAVLDRREHPPHDHRPNTTL